MAFDWKQYLDLARFLERQAGSAVDAEAALRTVVSRAYFSAFCHARNYARDWQRFQPKDDPDDHGRLRAHLKGKRRAADAERLERLRQWRNQCDYLDETPTNLQVMSLSAIAEAERVFVSLAPPSS